MANSLVDYLRQTQCWSQVRRRADIAPYVEIALQHLIVLDRFKQQLEEGCDGSVEGVAVQVGEL